MFTIFVISSFLSPPPQIFWCMVDAWVKKITNKKVKKFIYWVLFSTENKNFITVHLSWKFCVIDISENGLM